MYVLQKRAPNTKSYDLIFTNTRISRKEKTIILTFLQQRNCVSNVSMSENMYAKFHKKEHIVNVCCLCAHSKARALKITTSEKTPPVYVATPIAMNTPIHVPYMLQRESAKITGFHSNLEISLHRMHLQLHLS